MTQQELNDFIETAFNNDEFKKAFNSALQEIYNSTLVLGDVSLDKIKTDPTSIIELVGYKEFKYLLQRHQYNKDYITDDLINSITETTTINDVLQELTLNQIIEIIDDEINNKSRINENLKFETIKDLVNTQMEQYGLSDTMDLNELLENLVNKKIIEFDFVTYNDQFESHVSNIVSGEITNQLTSIIKDQGIKEIIFDLLTSSSILDQNYADIDGAIDTLITNIMKDNRLNGLNSFQVEALVSKNITDFVDNHTASRQIINYVLKDHKLNQWICETNYAADDLNPIQTSIDPDDESKTIETNECECDISDNIRAILTADNEVLEGSPIEYQIVLSESLSQDLTITLSNGAEIIIEAGARVGWVEVDTPEKDHLKHDSMVVVSIQGYQYEGPEDLELEYGTVALTKIKDDYVPVQLNAYFPTDVNNQADGGIKITFAVSELPRTDVRLFVDFNGEFPEEVIISAGTLSTTTTFVLPEDTYFFRIAAHGGGDYEKLILGPSIINGGFITVIGEAAMMLSISGPLSVTENKTANYIIELSSPLEDDLQVLVNEEMYTIPAGVTQYPYSLLIPTDYITNGIYTQTIVNVKHPTLNSAEFDFSTYGTTTANIEDVIDNTNIGIVGLASNEDDRYITYELTLNHTLSVDLLVRFKDGSSTTVYKGTSKKSITIPIDESDNIQDSTKFTKEIISVECLDHNYELENYTIDPAVATIDLIETINPVSIVIKSSVMEPVYEEEVNFKLVLAERAKMDLNITLLDGTKGIILKGQDKYEWSQKTPSVPGEWEVGISEVSYNEYELVKYEEINIRLAKVILQVQSPETATITFKTVPAIGTENETVSIVLNIDAASASDIDLVMSNNQTVKFPQGLTEVTFDYKVQNDIYITENEEISISRYSGGSFKHIDITDSKLISITDSIDDTALSLTTNNTKYSKNGNDELVLCTVQLTNPAKTDIRIELSEPSLDRQTIIIPAGSSTGKASISVDDLPTGEISLYVTEVTSHQFENLIVQNSTEATAVKITIEDYIESIINIENNIVDISEDEVSFDFIITSSKTPTEDIIITLDNGMTTSISSNTNSGTLNIPLDEEDVYLDDHYLTGKIVDVQGGGFDNIVLDNDTFKLNINDTIDLTTVNLISTPNVNGAETIDLTITLGNAPMQQFRITVQDDTNHIYNFDFDSNDLTKTIQIQPDNVTYDIVYTIKTIGSNEYEGIDQLNEGKSTTHVTQKVYTNATLEITDKGPVEVYEGNSEKAIELKVDFVPSTDINIELKVNSDKVQLTIPANETTVNYMHPIKDDNIYLDEKLHVFQILSATGGDFDSLTVDDSVVQLKVLDTIDDTTVELTAPTDVNGEEYIELTATLSNEGETVCVVKIEDDMSPKNSYDITISSGTLSKSTLIPTTNNDAFITYSIVDVQGGNFENVIYTSTASTTVHEVVPRKGIFDISGPSSADEGEEITLQVNVSETDESNITFTINVNDEDSTTLTGIINAGSLSGTVKYTIRNDVYAEDVFLEAKLVNVTKGQFDEVEISDQDTVYVSVNEVQDITKATLSVDNSLINWDDPSEITLSLDNIAKIPLKVTLNTGDTITILQDQSSEKITKDWTIQDADSTKTISIDSIDSSLNGKFEVIDSTTEAFITINALPEYRIILSAPLNVNETDDFVTVDIELIDNDGNPKIIEEGNISFKVNDRAGTIDTNESKLSLVIQTHLVNDVYINNNGILEYELIDLVKSDDLPYSIDTDNSTFNAYSNVIESVDTTTLDIVSPSILEESDTKVEAEITIIADNKVLETDLVCYIEYNTRNTGWVEAQETITVKVDSTTGKGNIMINIEDNLTIDSLNNIEFRISKTEGGNFEDLDISGVSSTKILDTEDEVKAKVEYTKPVDYKGDLSATTKYSYKMTLDYPADEDITFIFNEHLDESGNNDIIDGTEQVVIKKGEYTGTTEVKSFKDKYPKLDKNSDILIYLDSIEGSNFEKITPYSTETEDKGISIDEPISMYIEYSTVL